MVIIIKKVISFILMFLLMITVFYPSLNLTAFASSNVSSEIDDKIEPEGLIIKFLIKVIVEGLTWEGIQRTVTYVYDGYNSWQDAANDRALKSMAAWNNFERNYGVANSSNSSINEYTTWFTEGDLELQDSKINKEKNN